MLTPPARQAWRRAAFALVGLLCQPTGVSRDTRFITLNNGVRMPALALNTAGLPDAATVVELAVKLGFEHVEFHPTNAERGAIASALAKGAISRAETFLTTKLLGAGNVNDTVAYESTLTAAATQLALLGTDYIDLLLVRDIGAAGATRCRAMRAQWRAMEALVARGAARAIGVVNFCQAALECVLGTAKLVPAVNYYMHHVGMGADPRGLKSYCESRGIVVLGYGPLGEPAADERLLTAPALRDVAEAHGATAVQAALAWSLHGGGAVSVRPTAAFVRGCRGADGASFDEAYCAQQLSERMRATELVLSTAEKARLDGLTEPGGSPTLYGACAV